jgi:hypothetical protein
MREYPLVLQSLVYWVNTPANSWYFIVGCVGFIFQKLLKYNKLKPFIMFKMSNIYFNKSLALNIMNLYNLNQDKIINQNTYFF